jgi:hypothetical protein
MASIATVGRNKYRATFNKRSLVIDAGATLTATDTATNEVLRGAELQSVAVLINWHVKTKRDSNELVTVATMR